MTRLTPHLMKTQKLIHGGLVVFFHVMLWKFPFDEFFGNRKFHKSWRPFIWRIFFTYFLCLSKVERRKRKVSKVSNLKTLTPFHLTKIFKSLKYISQKLTLFLCTTPNFYWYLFLANYKQFWMKSILIRVKLGSKLISRIRSWISPSSWHFGFNVYRIPFTFAGQIFSVSFPSLCLHSNGSQFL